MFTSLLHAATHPHPHPHAEYMLPGLLLLAAVSATWWLVSRR